MNEEEFIEKAKRMIKYPEEWDTVAFPTVFDALYEIISCNEEVRNDDI